jgi:tRNA pseudouridine65 synthase
MPDLQILFQDSHYVAVDKPPGLFVHPTRLGPREPSCLPWLRRQLDRQVFTVHRLDRATSGVLLFALSSEAAREICRLFEKRSVDKAYLAVVRGFTPESGCIDSPLRESKDKEPADAATNYTRLETVELPEPVGRFDTARFSLVEVQPRTGRMHQIRKHFARISHPVIGDANHGDGTQNRFFRDHFGLRRLLLMATHLGFRHPYSGEPATISAPVPDDVRALFDQLGWPADGS